MTAVASRSVATSIALVCCALAFAGCAKKSMVTPPQVASPPPAPVATKPAPAPVLTPAPAPTPAPTVEASDFHDVFFDFDQYALSADARASLDVDAKVLRDHPATRITIEGHCDERGTVEYNMSLGESRANAARDYLVAAGVNASQIQTISYGKERPFCPESNEACWAKNRCGHVVLRSGPA